jgi:hypothetical protein
LAENRIRELLQLAGVPASDKKAAAWLNAAIAGAKDNYRAAQERPLSADHNAMLADIEVAARKLTKRLERLRRHPVTWRSFWHSSVFGPVLIDRFEVPDVLTALERIIGAAGSAKDPRHGRRREVGNQHVVNLALGFFERFSPHRPSGTATGVFSKFAREFYFTAIGVHAKQHGGLDRQIRAAARLFIERQAAQRKSAKKPRQSS